MSPAQETRGGSQGAWLREHETPCSIAQFFKNCPHLSWHYYMWIWNKNSRPLFSIIWHLQNANFFNKKNGYISRSMTCWWKRWKWLHIKVYECWKSSLKHRGFINNLLNHNIFGNFIWFLANLLQLSPSILGVKWLNF